MTLPPGPRSPTAIQTLRWMFRPIELLHECRREYGRCFTLRLAGQPFVFSSDRETIRRLFAARDSDVHAGEVAALLRVLVGDHSLLVLDGPEHLRQRKLLAPAFHAQQIRSYAQVMAQVTQAEVRTWAIGKPFALLPRMRHITLEIILRTVFGVDQATEVGALYRELSRLLRLGDLPMSTLWMGHLSSRPEREQRFVWSKLLEPRKRADALLFREIAARRSQPNAGRSDVLSLLLQARDENGDPMTDREIRDELITALVAGHETTAITLAWAFEAILSRPEILERLRAELHDVSSKEDAAGSEANRPIALDRIGDCAYLDATIKETLRLRPVISVVGRVLKQPMRLGEWSLPSNTIVTPCIYLAHHDPEFHPEPETFRPERFLGNAPEPDIWLPFGGGIRRCIGAAFATFEMKIVLATILSELDLQLLNRKPARVVRRAIAFAPKGGIRVRVEGWRR